eukprot:669460-Prorocentrum_minimum.AAC.1
MVGGERRVKWATPKYPGRGVFWCDLPPPPSTIKLRSSLLPPLASGAFFSAASARLPEYNMNNEVKFLYNCCCITSK